MAGQSQTQVTASLSPEVIGCQLHSAGDQTAAGLPGTDADADVRERAPGLHLGLFESHETVETYLARRRWFHDQSRSPSGADASGEPFLRKRQHVSRSHGHHPPEQRDDYIEPVGLFESHETVATYRRRREWFYEQARTPTDKPWGISQDEIRLSLGQAKSAPRASTQAWRTLVRVLCIIVLALSVWFSANSFVAEIADDYGVSKNEATLLTVVVNLGFTVCATGSAVAQLPDRLPPSRLLCIGCLGCCLSSALLATGLPFEVLLAARFLNGMALAFVYPTLMRLTAGWFPAEQRGLALGSVIGGLTVGIALPNLLKASLPGVPWQRVSLGTSVLALVASFLTCGVSDGPFAQRTAAFSCSNVLSILKSSNWVLVTLSYCGHNIELFGGWAWMGEFLLSLGEDASWKAVASAVAFTIVAVGSLGAVIGGVLADRMGKRRFILSMHLLSGTTIAVIPSAAKVLPRALVVLLAGIWGMAVIADSAQYSALLAEVLPEKRLLGTAITLSLALGFISTAVGVYAVPLLVQWGGWDGAFPCLALGPALGIVCIWLVRSSA
eukprot:TRINITY_DN64992_c0_g1_i1.p1 TRINITY_DN64992_c0_g1~~TRINITY_DN64992_c0_g1_i1.p1  ORF type:complete len:555 (+),score=32.31 TRINITY_DN64992_c0_g1_i1:246-1910(+)